MATQAAHDVIELSAEEAERLLSGRNAAPHAVLGSHEVTVDGQVGLLVRAMHPDAIEVSARIEGRERGLTPLSHAGLFGAFLPGVQLPQHPELTFVFRDGQRWTRVDPYSFWPTLGDHDLYLFGEGKHFQVWHALGAREREHEGLVGTAFAVWAPTATSVHLVCDDNGWDGRLWPMRAMGSSGIFELFVPGVVAGCRYQFDVRTQQGHVLRKSDPFAEAADHPPGRASIVTKKSEYVWGDAEHMMSLATRDLARRPMSVYEVHLGSFARHPDGSVLNYRELAHAIIPHMQHFGFTHLELLPICEHPFDGSWGYQVTGFYAPTSRFGTPDDFRYLVDQCHRAGIDVILDWVPAHFPKDDFALAKFDGTALYEHEDPRRGEHPDWGTLIFNYGRHEVANFLLGSALYFLDEFHIDGLRFDAVASMLYLDYSRDGEEWVPNPHGGRENLDALGFLRHLNEVIRERYPGCYTIAEESTSWAGVTAPVSQGGLGFHWKWNMGWMHDTLMYFEREPVHRRYHQNELTFASVYEHSERFLMPLSHDEVVHGKGSLLTKMPGDRWQKFANLRALLAYQYTRPGKKLLFMGSEFAPDTEWDHARALPRPAADDGERQAYMRFMAELGQLYLRCPALHASDETEGGFRFVDASDHAQSVISYLRAYGGQQLLVVLSLTPVPRGDYRIGAPGPGRYRAIFNSDDRRFGGSEWRATEEVPAEPIAMHGFDHSVRLSLPPLGVLVLEYEEAAEVGRARRVGIADHYFTIDGKRHVTSDATRTALLSVLGEGPDAEPALRDAGASRMPAYHVEQALGDRGALGFWTQLYSLRSKRNWGVGDLGDLEALLRWAASEGLDFIGLNPLHAMHPLAHPAIPYHPITRLFESPLHIDVERVPEYQIARERGCLPSDLAERREQVRMGGEVPYPAVYRLKRDALRAGHRELYKEAPDHPRRQALSEFAQRGGQVLYRFAIYSAVIEALSDAGKPAWGYPDFPEPLRDVNSRAVSQFAEEHAELVDFHVYLQFVVDEQLSACQALSRALGMGIGLYLDLAVGAAHGSFDEWCFPHLYVRGVSLGAPPDALAPQGQDWGIVPLHPRHVLDHDCEHVRTLFHRTMRHAGAMRIDHAMWLARQFWLPHVEGAQGTYVRFPIDHLVDVLVEESRRAACIVIAEDLGTVPDGFREMLTARAILRYEVVPFARDEAGELLAIDAFDRQALLCLSTHDLPTFGEFWRGGDLMLRREMGVLDETQMLAAVSERVLSKDAFGRFIARHGLEFDPHADPETLLRQLHQILAGAPSALLCLSLDDLTGEPHSVNVPGTSSDQGFTSFARRMQTTVEDIIGRAPLADALASLVSLRKPGT